LRFNIIKDIIESQERLGNLLIDFLSQNKDTVEVIASEEDKLAPLYQQLLAMEKDSGWRPQLWSSTSFSPQTHTTDLHNLSGDSAFSRKFEKLAKDPRTTHGLMEMTRLGKYYRTWNGFTVNHLSGETLNSTASVS
jgi:hypothetical protein